MTQNDAHTSVALEAKYCRKALVLLLKCMISYQNITPCSKQTSKQIPELKKNSGIRSVLQYLYYYHLTDYFKIKSKSHSKAHFTMLNTIYWGEPKTPIHCQQYWSNLEIYISQQYKTALLLMSTLLTGSLKMVFNIEK